MKALKIIGIGLIVILLALIGLVVIGGNSSDSKVNKDILGKWKVVDCGAIDANNKSEPFVAIYSMILPKSSTIEITKNKFIIQGQGTNYRIEDGKFVITNKDNTETYADVYLNDKGQLVFKIGNFAAIMDNIDNTGKK
ncbi:hypothetical protein [Clostridium folliculivorans]|uniref:hypothetical protein n=1 Tax=Clostridium folliculivorans TaxID=2886038 RepID=UPI0021C3BD77|nr:hypothetical protein [Clostridium folliculivorans]GKU29329.1 hypothetical protein CFB3_14350 [Clostridium folliculivorans]